MLSDQVTELLTAFVDGELGQRQRKAVMRLLHRSSEAREFLRQLQENAHRIKQLPRHKLEPSLVEEITFAIASQQQRPVQIVQRRPVSRHWKPYVAASLAASLMLGAFGLVYWMSMNGQESQNPAKDQGTNIAKVQPEKKQEVRPAPEPMPAPRKPTNPMLASIVEGTYNGFGAPLLAEEKTFAFEDLKKENAAGRLMLELNRDKTVQLDITVKNNSIAMERLKSALFDRGIRVVVDVDAKKSLQKKAQGKIEYLVYAENMTASEVTKMLSELSLDDRTGKVSSIPSPYQKVVIAPLAKNEKTQIGDVLGIDLTKSEKEVPAKKMERWERVAVVLPATAGTNPSAEVRQFASLRLKPQAGTVQLLIRIHQD